MKEKWPEKPLIFNMRTGSIMQKKSAYYSDIVRGKIEVEGSEL